MVCEKEVGCGGNPYRVRPRTLLRDEYNNRLPPRRNDNGFLCCFRVVFLLAIALIAVQKHPEYRALAFLAFDHNVAAFGLHQPVDEE